MLETSAEKTERIPIRIDPRGAVRLGDTQVTLDVVMDAYDQGATPEQIVQKFGELRLDDVYAVITYCLRHSQEVRAYLDRRKREAGELRREAGALSPRRTSRERLLRTKARRQEPAE